RDPPDVRSSAAPGSLLRVEALPDQSVNRDPPRKVAQARNERNQDECHAHYRHGQHHEEIDTRGRVVRRDLVPHLEKPEPRLTWIAIGAIHEPPLRPPEGLMLR